MGIETIYNCGQKFLNNMEALKKFRIGGELLAQQLSICLPGNVVGNTGMGSESGWQFGYWDGVIALLKVGIQLRSGRHRWPGWVPTNSI